MSTLGRLTVTNSDTAPRSPSSPRDRRHCAPRAGRGLPSHTLPGSPRMARTRLAFFAAAVALAAAHPAAAQQTNTINATATVVTPLAVSSVSALAFGTVYPGVNKTVN